MNPNDRLMAWSQIGLSIALLLGLFVVIVVFELGYSHLVSADQQRLFERLLHFLEDATLLVLYFWFQRMRQGGIPDAPQTITQSRTSPDGSKTEVTSPAHLPPPKIPDPTTPH